jgi:hypothetical protein
MTNNALTEVANTTAALNEAAEFPHRAVIHANDHAVSIAIWDIDADAYIDVHPQAVMEMCPYTTLGDLGIFQLGLADRNVKWNALAWLRANGWEPAGDPQASAWRVTEPLPVRPIAADGLSLVALAASRIGQAEEARDEAIRKALAAGHSVISIAEAANLSRARIYQIRDGRR